MRQKRMLDPELGELVRKRGRWRGTVSIEPDVVVPLVLPGGRSGPSSEVIAAARDIPSQFAACSGEIKAALLDHHPDSGSDLNPDPMHGAGPTPLYATVLSLDGRLAAEIGYRVPWDDEHTLGACLRDGQLIELNGSVLPP